MLQLNHQLTNEHASSDGSAWRAAACDLRGALLRSGISEIVIGRLLTAIARPFAAIERGGGVVDEGLLWAMVAAQADIYRSAGRAPAGALSRVKNSV